MYCREGLRSGSSELRLGVGVHARAGAYIVGSATKGRRISPSDTVFSDHSSHWNTGSWTLNRFPAALFTALVVLLGACDSDPLAPDPLARPPFVAELIYTPDVVAVDELPSSSRVGESVRIPVTIQVSAGDADGDLSRVSYVIRAPIAQNQPVSAGDLVSQGSGVFGLSKDVLFPAALTGGYVVIVYPVDGRGVLGNEVRGVIELAATGNPPVIESIEAPDRVVRPAPGQPPVPIVLIATVSDPDGLINVARVEMRVNGGALLLLCDDGGQSACNPGFASGDQTAGDGRFTLTLQIESGNTPGERSLEFKAVDRGGLVSEPVTRVLTIE